MNLVPFPGFRAFRTEENYLFFGREGLTDEIIGRLSNHKFVAVTGVSGSGKSSLVKAGLVPDLHRGLFGEAGSKWVDIQFSPKNDPTENLISALLKGLPVKRGQDIPCLEKSIISSRSEGISDYYELAETDSNLLIVVDQFEELFRFERISNENKEEAMFFVELLKQAVLSAFPIYVILTMRSDFLGNCAGFPGLLELINESQYLVPRLKRQELQRAIEKPAKIGKATFSTPLISSILNDVIDSIDQLPQLQHSLRLTWLNYLVDKNAEGVINQTHYEAIGGMIGSLGSQAKGLYNDDLNNEQQFIAELVFKTITELGPERKAIRKPVSLQVLHDITAYELNDLKEVIDIFRKEGANFIQPFDYDMKELNESSIIDISHESLINAWEDLKGWVDTEAKLVNKLRLIYSKIEIQGTGSNAFLTGLDLDLGIALINERKFNRYWIKHVMPIAEFKEEDYQMLLEKIKNYVTDSTNADNDIRNKILEEQLVVKKQEIRGKLARWIAIMSIIIGLFLYYLTIRSDILRKKSESSRVETIKTLRNLNFQKAKEFTNIGSQYRDYQEDILALDAYKKALQFLDSTKIKMEAEITKDTINDLKNKILQEIHGMQKIKQK